VFVRLAGVATNASAGVGELTRELFVQLLIANLSLTLKVAACFLAFQAGKLVRFLVNGADCYFGGGHASSERRCD
jgi:hypothetical protein